MHTIVFHFRVWVGGYEREIIVLVFLSLLYADFHPYGMVIYMRFIILTR